MIDLDDETITENTCTPYPFEYIDDVLSERRAGYPKNVVPLTSDASGMMSPIATLTPEQTMYQFMRGAKVGLGKEPEITFSACFGGPFMEHHP